MLKKLIFAINPLSTDFGLLLLRLGTSGLMITHGWGKIANYSENLTKFADPLGIGTQTSLVLAIFAEFFCSILLALGFFSRLALIPLIITMVTAAFMVHGGNFSKQELPLLFLIAFLTLFFTGPGKYSLDAQVKPTKKY